MMGLRVSHDAWVGPYSRFDRFRCRIAAVCEIPLDLMEGHCDQPMVTGMRHHDEMLLRRVWRWVPIKWSVLKADPIHTLLHHSDCDGDIKVDDLLPLAGRLRSIAPALGGESENPKFWEECAIRFAEGCERAFEAGEPLIFS